MNVQTIRKGNKNLFAVIPYNEYEELLKKAEDYDDIISAQRARKSKLIPWEKAKKELLKSK